MSIPVSCAWEPVLQLPNMCFPPFAGPASSRSFRKCLLSLFSGNSSEVEKALQEHRIDLALVEGNTRQPNLKYTPFLQDELVAIVHTHSKWMDYDEITLDELKEVPLVLREKRFGNIGCIDYRFA